MSNLKLILFDVDGTLIDSQRHIIAAMRAAFAAENTVAPSDDAIRSIIGLSLVKAMRVLAPGADPEALSAAYRTAFVGIRDAAGAMNISPLFPGARAALDRLAQIDDYILGIATGKSRRGLDHLFQTHDLATYFSTSQVADHHPSKPHPAMVQAAMSETGVSPENTVLVRDTSFDMQMAQAAGAHALGVTWGYHSTDRLRNTGARQLLASFADLDSKLESLWGRG